jgi:hypothetical protein
VCVCSKVLVSLHEAIAAVWALVGYGSLLNVSIGIRSRFRGLTVLGFMSYVQAVLVDWQRLDL